MLASHTHYGKDHKVAYCVVGKAVKLDVSFTVKRNSAILGAQGEAERLHREMTLLTPESNRLLEILRDKR